ncbi:MAG: hypothetical protein M0R73_09770 [Dehalococcoidia bacterium]|nr:hypothetical protein [Dehalococcoidia bacterium]
MVIRRRDYEPLGIILAHDHGLATVVPGGEPQEVVAGHRFTSTDYYDGLAMAGAPGVGAWVHDGKRWKQRWEGDARSVSVLPNGDLFIGVGDGRLVRSTDRGETWEELEGVLNVIKHGNNFVPPRGESKCFVRGVVQVEEGIVLAIGGGGAWHTRDNGNTWLRRTDGLDAKMHGVWSHPEHRDRLYATSDSGVFRSEDEGFSWLQSLGGLDRSWGGTLAIMPGAPDALILSMARHAPPEPGGSATEGTVFRSPNGGVSWARVMLEGDDEWPRIPCVTRPWDWEDVAFVAAGEKLWASHDRGKNWLALSDGLPVANSIAASL